MLVLVAIIIAIGSLLTSNYLITDLQHEERNKMEVWAEAMRSLNSADENTDIGLVLKVINGNNTIPVVVLDKYDEPLTYRNINKTFSSDEDSIAYVKKLAIGYRNKGRHLRIDLPNDNDFLTICYSDSLILSRLELYPYVQLFVVVIFVIIALFAIFSTMRSEQNKIWVGLSKETAHQLGTPISSLMAWNEVLRDSYPDDPLLPEMQKDVKRLERIAERFSKIGSIPEPKPTDLVELLRGVVGYMDRRTSNKIVITSHFPDEPVIINLIPSLFEWVVENLCKNAVDAMSGAGRIDVFIEEELEECIVVEVLDTGKGIPQSKYNSVFKPGFTTKERGWGLGLSLAKRIVVDYHRGRIFVKESALGVGTTFRIELPRIG